MADTPVIDLASLLLPIPGDNPAGSPQAYAFEIREQLEVMRTEERPEDFDDATRPEQLKKADWPGLVQKTQEALVSQSKDLRLACHLIEGLTRVQGFAGLKAGLELLCGLVEQCWDRVNPPLEEDDPESRSLPLINMLDDADRGIRFPNVVRSVPTFGSLEGGFSLLDWNRLRANADPESGERYDKAVAATTYEQLKAIDDDLTACLAQIQKLVAALDARLGAAAPSFSNLSAALAECQRLVGQELSRKAPPEVAAGSADSPTGEAGSPQQACASRSQAYAQLNRVAEVLQELEPHSPIPYLVKRAVQLGRLPFPLLIQEMVRDANLLQELNREFGIRETSTETSSGA